MRLTIYKAIEGNGNGSTWCKGCRCWVRNVECGMWGGQQCVLVMLFDYKLVPHQEGKVPKKGLTAGEAEKASN